MILGLCMRWLHVTSVVLLIGGVYYALRTSRSLSPAFGSTIYAAIAGVLISGLYNFFMKPAYPPRYHMWFGIKVLLALHILAASILLVRRAQGTVDQSRRMRGIMISAAVVIAISGYLRWISITPVVKLP